MWIWIREENSKNLATNIALQWLLSHDSNSLASYNNKLYWTLVLNKVEQVNDIFKLNLTAK